MSENKEYSSLSELENDKSKWNLESDLKLLHTLKYTTDEISRKIQNNSTFFDDLNYKSRVCTDKINNLITNVLILTNSKFIENRVYDEDIKEIAPVKPSAFKKDDQFNTEQVVIERLKNSITCGINCFTQKYDLSPSDIENFDKTNLLGTLYLNKNRFASRPLPYLIGSDDFTKDTFVGLKAENDNPVIVLNKTNHLEIKDDDDEFEPLKSNDNISDGSDASSGLFNISTPNKVDGKLNGYLVSHEETKEALFSPVSNNNNLFESDIDEDDIFSERIASNRQQNTVTATSPAIKTDFRSNNQAIVTEIKTVPAFKQNNDFFNSISDGESEDDLFEKKRPTSVPAANFTNTDVKSTISPSLNDTANQMNSKPNEQKSTVVPVVSKPTASKPVKSTLDSIFSSDDEDIDIFSVKISKPKTDLVKESQSKKSNKVSAFSSSDEDEDDLFSHLNKSKNKIPVSKITNVVSATTESPKISIENSPPKESSNSKSISSKVPFLPNVISELTVAIKSKKVEIEEPFSSDNSSSDEPKKTVEINKINHLVATESNVHSVLKVNETSDSFNDILKHKAKLNSKRNRKMPTRYSRSSLGSVLPEVQNEVPPIVPEKIDQVPETQHKVESVLPLVKNVDPLPKSVLSSSDDSESDLFATNLSKKNVQIPSKSVQDPNLGKSSVNVKPNKISLFDSSDDSDSDIFSKTLIKTNTSKVVTKESTNVPVQISLYDDSDEDDDFLTSSLMKTPKESVKSEQDQQKKINQISEKKSVNVKKSIFDDDSDDDDLFK